jgi:alginate O-acetyltransferase complex protein AlgI
VVFYTWGAGEFVFWLLGSSLANWLFALFAGPGESRNTRLRSRIAVAASVVANVAMLSYFKYANFFVQDILGAGEIYGWETVALPIGISFFTFQGMSYVIDVSRGEEEPLRNPLDVALYIACFPQLIAGPIVRYGTIAKEIHDRTISWDNFSTGATRFALGLSKKILIADSVAPLADAAFAAGPALTTPDAWLGIIAYTIQIYFDFSGYSDMAIGIGRILGFHFPENFRRPYSSTTVTDFWRRWHISLSSWFRDYLYIPLGGSRAASAKTYFNLFLVFIVTGIWHGADWTFLFWGIYHGSGLVVERITGLRSYVPSSTATRALSRLACLVFVAMGWVLFRAEGLGEAGLYYQTLFGLTASDAALPTHIEIDSQMWIALGAGLAACFLSGEECAGVWLERAQSKNALVLAYAIAAIAFPAALVLVASGSYTSFLYFRF